MGVAMVMDIVGVAVCLKVEWAPRVCVLGPSLPHSALAQTHITPGSHLVTCPHLAARVWGDTGNLAASVSSHFELCTLGFHDALLFVFQCPQPSTPHTC